MNSTASIENREDDSKKLTPIVKETLFDDYTSRVRNDAVSLVSKLSDAEIQDGIMIIRSSKPSFTQTRYPQVKSREVKVGTASKPATRSVTQYFVPGKINTFECRQLYCPICRKPLYSNGTVKTTVKDLPQGGAYVDLVVTRQRYLCSKHGCGYTWTEPIDFKAQNHLITVELENYVRDLLRLGETMKDISILTGLHQNVIKEIDRDRLKELYTVNGDTLKKPDYTCECLGIDEFLLHKGHKFATLIMDLKTGHVLYLAHGKKKQTVYDFINWIGMDWMKHVKAVACDMNSDFEEAFKEKCSWISIVYDHFHLIKNFNDKVISEVRKDEQKRLIEEGNIEAANALKGSKYIMMTTEETRKQKEKDAKDGKVISRGNKLFNKPEIRQSAGIEEQYQKLLKENKLLFTLDLVKEQLKKAYETDSERGMKIHINRVIRTCRATENEHFMWFARLIEKHYEGIIAYARLHISTGKVEGTNQMIKTLRRKSYGYPDDEYFFLKIIDSSHRYSTLS